MAAKVVISVVLKLSKLSVDRGGGGGGGVGATADECECINKWGRRLRVSRSLEKMAQHMYPALASIQNSVNFAGYCQAQIVSILILVEQCYMSFISPKLIFDC